MNDPGWVIYGFELAMITFEWMLQGIWLWTESNRKSVEQQAFGQKKVSKTK